MCWERNVFRKKCLHPESGGKLIIIHTIPRIHIQYIRVACSIKCQTVGKSQWISTCTTSTIQCSSPCSCFDRSKCTCFPSHRISMASFLRLLKCWDVHLRVESRYFRTIIVSHTAGRNDLLLGPIFFVSALEATRLAVSSDTGGRTHNTADDRL